MNRTIKTALDLITALATGVCVGLALQLFFELCLVQTFSWGDIALRVFVGLCLAVISSRVVCLFLRALRCAGQAAEKAK